MLSRFKLIVQAAPDFAVDIPLIWQYIAEVVGAFIGAPSSNMLLLKPLIASVPDDKVEKFFHAVIRYATEFSVSQDRSTVLSMESISFSPKPRSNASGKHLVYLSMTSSNLAR